MAQARTLTYSITGVTTGHLINCSVSSSHGSATSVASIEVTETSLSLGSPVTVDIGDDVSGTHRVFKGYVKSVSRNVPDNTITIVANDDLIRAVDMFIVSSDPAHPLTYGGAGGSVTAEALIAALLTLAGITSTDLGTSYYTFGTSNEFEIAQVSVYDYCKQIADLLAWNIWCDELGVVHFQCRKPVTMVDSPTIPGWVNDSNYTSYTWNDNKVISMSRTIDNNDLRNRVLVYGPEGVFAEASNDTIDSFHWKSTVLAAPDLIDTTAIAQDTANFNLQLLNRLTDNISATVEGDSNLLPFRAINVNSTYLGIESGKELYYIFSANHDFGRDGYVTKLELRR
jgi:hypothetical protein